MTSPTDAQIIEYIKTADSEQRSILLDFPRVWGVHQIKTWEVLLAVLFLGITVFTMGLVYSKRHIWAPHWNDDSLPNHADDARATDEYVPNGLRTSVFGKERRCKNLLLRDFGPMSFEVPMEHERASVSEYRGLIHWFRDALEKLLSICLLIAFSVFLARAVGYAVQCSKDGGEWVLCFLPLDVNIALVIIGLGLIVDGLIHVSTMTDAPGIGRTLDSVIVVLAGFVVMLVEAAPGAHAAVKFTVSPEIKALALVMGALFFIRWMVRHHDVAEFIGSQREKNKVRLR